MNTKPFRFAFVLFLSALWLPIFLLPSASHAETADYSFDIIIKVSQLENALNVIDGLMESATGAGEQSPIFLLRGMLQGTDWIDPSRVLVLGIKLGGAQPEMAALIPYVKPNDNFQSMFNAQNGPDYYLLPLPPGQPREILETEKAELVKASRTRARTSLTVDIYLTRLLTENKAQIQSQVLSLDYQPQGPAGGQFDLSPQEVQGMMLKMLDLAGQLQQLSLNLDFKQDKVSFACMTSAKQGSALYQLFIPGHTTTLLDSYRPKNQMVFRSRSYDFRGMFAIIDDVFGSIYQKMGINFTEIANVVKHFTGEMAGGVSFGKSGVQFEAICVLKDRSGAEKFLENIYLPWLLKYGKDFSKAMEKQMDTPIDQIYTRTTDTKVLGRKVIGIKTKMPIMPGFGGPSTSVDFNKMTAAEMRMTTVDNMMIIAPNDQTMARLIQTAKKLKPKTSPGTLFNAEMDISAYFNMLANIVPEMAEQTGTLPKGLKISMTANANKGTGIFSYSIKTEHLKTLIAQLKNISVADLEKAGTGTPKPTASTTRKQPPPKTVKQENTPGYWIDKGTLASTYGAEKSAIRHFKRAIKIDPMKPQAYFHLAVSYGEIGRYQEALVQIDKAIALDDQNGAYYYGRGRIYLLAGDQLSADRDFRQAAALGNNDADNYLRRVAPRAGE